MGGEEGRGVVDGRRGIKLKKKVPVAQRTGQAPFLQGAEEFVKFIGGVEVCFEIAGGQVFAEIV